MNGLHLILIFMLASPQSSYTSDDLRQCSSPRLVSIEGSDLEIRDALRAIADQGKVNIGMRAGLEGRVSVRLRCVEAKTALRIVLAQVDAAFCEEGASIYVDRSQRIVCGGLLTVPPPNERVAHRDSKRQRVDFGKER